MSEEFDFSDLSTSDVLRVVRDSLEVSAKREAADEIATRFNRLSVALQQSLARIKELEAIIAEINDR